MRQRYSKGSRTTDRWGPGDVLVVNSRPCTSPSNHAGTSRNCKLRASRCRTSFLQSGLWPRARALQVPLFSFFPPNLKAETCNWSGSSLSVRRGKFACGVFSHLDTCLTCVWSITWTGCARRAAGAHRLNSKVLEVHHGAFVRPPLGVWAFLV